MGLLVFYLLLIASFVYIYRQMPRRSQRPLLLALLVYYLFYWSINHFMFSLKGASVDAVKFQSLGFAISKGASWDFGLGAQFFSGWLGFLYELFGVGHASISLVSILMVMGSFFFMVKIIDELDLNPHAIWGVIIFLLLPSMVFRSVTTLREAYILAIAQKVERNWQRPAGSEKMPECEVNVLQGPGGIILDVSFGACGGSTATYRASIENAVYKAEPLPKPEDPALFDRDIKFTFRPFE